MDVTAVAEERMRDADAAELLPFETIEETGAFSDSRCLGNAWTRRYYDGDFVLMTPPPGRPAISLVFVQSVDGNTGARRPETLGGGVTDKHFIYEGLSRVSADAVLSGASSARGAHAFFSVWRREFIEFRHALGLPRHPAQIVASRRGNLDIRGTLLFNVPSVRVIVLAGRECRDTHAAEFARRPHIAVIPFDNGWTEPLESLRRDHGIERISAIGGRRTATSLIDAGAVQDLCLTKTRITGGEPNTPYYVGERPPQLQLIVRKRQPRAPDPIEFEHLAVLI
jgi:riboflavin biosynthesis pyrimidine reductase